MSCCGSKRRQVIARGSANEVPVKPQFKQSYSAYHMVSEQVFEYIGLTALTVRGPISGRLYRFSRFNPRCTVNKHDAPAMMGIPNLRLVTEVHD